MNELPLIEGVSVQITGSVQTAIEQAGAAYRRKFGRPPSHVSLPGWCTPNAAMLFDGALTIARPTSKSQTRARHQGTVIVGRPVGTREGPARQLELL